MGDPSAYRGPLGAAGIYPAPFGPYYPAGMRPKKQSVAQATAGYGAGRPLITQAGYHPGGYRPVDPHPMGYYSAGYYPAGYYPAGYYPPDYHPGGHHPAGHYPLGFHLAGNRPADYRPAEYRPMEYRPAEHRPAEHHPVEHRPVDPRPVDPRPVDNRPADKQDTHPIMAGLLPANHQAAGYSRGIATHSRLKNAHAKDSNKQLGYRQDLHNQGVYAQAIDQRPMSLPRTPQSSLARQNVGPPVNMPSSSGPGALVVETPLICLIPSSNSSRSATPPPPLPTTRRRRTLLPSGLTVGQIRKYKKRHWKLRRHYDLPLAPIDNMEEDSNDESSDGDCSLTNSTRNGKGRVSDSGNSHKHSTGKDDKREDQNETKDKHVDWSETSTICDSTDLGADGDGAMAPVSTHTNSLDEHDARGNEREPAEKTGKGRARDLNGSVDDSFGRRDYKGKNKRAADDSVPDYRSEAREPAVDNENSGTQQRGRSLVCTDVVTKEQFEGRKAKSIDKRLFPPTLAPGV